MVRFKLPDIGEGVVEAEIVEWRVGVGDVIEEDQSLLDVMTDKATVDIPSPVSGRVTRVHGAPGDTVPVGSVIIEIDAQMGTAPAPTAAPPKAAPIEAKPAAPQPAAPPPAHGGADGAVLQFKLPDVGEGVVEAEIVEWRVAVGDEVEEDQSLVDVMTDKATVDIPSPATGKVVRLHGEPGDIAAVGSVIIEIQTAAAGAPVVEAVERVVAVEPASEPAAIVQETPAATTIAVSSKPVVKTEVIAAPKRAEAAPAVRKRVLDAGLELSAIPGTGPGGRVTHADVDAVLSQNGALSAPRPTAVRARREGRRELKIIGLRRKIAKAMSHAASTIPHFAYVEEVDVTALEGLRKHLNDTREADQAKLTLLPFLCQALVRVLPDFPEGNAVFDNETGVLTAYEGVHVGVATATPEGLLVPVLRHAEARDVWDCASEIKRLAEAARSGRCSREELSGSTITISSLGPLGGVASTPVINAPEVAIIGVNKIVERPAFDATGRVVPRQVMNLSSSFDHRIVDGDVAARLIQRVKALLEQPAALFM